MATNVGRIYRELLISGISVPPALQQRIFDYGKAQKDFDLLVYLQRLATLDDAVDAQLGKITNHNVQAAHVSRPGRDMSALSTQAKKDRRVAVHANLASMPGLSDEAYEIMACNTSRTVAFPLCENKHVPLQFRRRAMRTIASTIATGNSREVVRYQHLLGNYPDLAAEAISTVAGTEVVVETQATDPNAMLLLRTYLGNSQARASIDDLSAPVAESLIGILISQFEPAAKQAAQKTQGWYSYEVRRALADLMDMAYMAATQASVDQSRREALLGTINTHRTVIETVNDGKSKFQKTKDMLSKVPETAGSLSPARLANETDLEVLRNAARNFDTSAPAAEAIAAAIISNPVSDAEVVSAVINRHGFRVDTRVLIAKRITDIPVASALLCVNPYLLDDEVLAASGQPEELIRRLVADESHYMPTRVASSRYMTKELVGDFPVSFLDDMHRTVDSGAIRAMVATYLAEQLGDSPRVWEMFESIVQNASGTIRSMIDQIHLLTA